MSKVVRSSWNTLDGWRKVDAQAVARGSEAQAANVLEMALQDLILAFEQIEAAGVKLERKRPDAPLIFRNRN